MNLLRHCCFVLVLLSSPLFAALPAEVEGQPMPSLAPMLERTTAAVVNVSSKTRVQVRNPFFDDPFFQRFFNQPNVPRSACSRAWAQG